MKKCVCCGEANNTHIHSENGFDYFECNKCGFIFSPLLDKQIFPQKRKVAQKEIDFWAKWGERRKSFFLKQLNVIRKIKPNGKALDIGCGTGAFLHILDKYYDAAGIEPNKILCDIGKELYNNNIKCCLLSDINGKFDIIYLMDVLEHMPKPATELDNIKKLMNKDAVLIIRVPNASYVKFKKFFFDLFNLTDKVRHGCFGAPGHLSHFSKKSLFTLLEKRGFKIIKYHPARSNIEDKLHLRILTSGIYYLGLILYYISSGKINIVIDHLVIVKKDTYG